MLQNGGAENDIKFALHEELGNLDWASLNNDALRFGNCRKSGGHFNSKDLPAFAFRSLQEFAAPTPQLQDAPLASEQ